MIQTETIKSLAELLQKVSSCLVIVGENPSYDQVACSVSFSEALQASGKEVSLISPVELAPEMSTLLGVERFLHKLGNQSLSVKFPYDVKSVDKVSYHISDDEKTFYLLIKPQKGNKPLAIDTVSFDYIGAETDMIFLFGVHKLETLDHLYEGFEGLYERAPIVTIHTFEPDIGNLKIDISKYAAYSEAMVGILQHLQLPLSVDAATNLLAGIEMVTEGFSSSLTTAETFDSVALLMRQGARRIRPHQIKQTSVVAALPSQRSGEVMLKAETKSSPSPSVGQSEGVLQPKSAVPKKEKKKKSPQPGDLDYQPGAEGSVGGRG
jgi:hypothetical protein